MEKQKKTVGVVLKEHSYGEHGKRLTLLTEDLGLITVFAHGAKKANSPLLAGTQPFVFAKFELYQGKDAYSLRGVEMINSFYSLRVDLLSMAYAMYLSELALAFMQEGMSGKRLLRLIYMAWKELEEACVSKPQIRAVFELRLMMIAGYQPELSVCVRCSGSQDLRFFSVEDSGAVCIRCAHKKDISFSSGIWQAFRYILDEPISKIFRFQIAPAQEAVFFRMMRNYTKQYLDYPMKSEEFLDEVSEKERI